MKLSQYFDETALPPLGFFLVGLIISTIVGCSPTVPPDNSKSNELTMRQQLIELFQTAEVVPVPSLSRHYLIRDHNGTVWFMRADQTDEAGTVMLFPGRSNLWRLPTELRSTNEPARLPMNKVILEDTNNEVRVR